MFEKLFLYKELSCNECKIKHKQIVIYGMGVASTNIEKELQNENLNIVAYCDSFSRSEDNKTFNSKPVISRDELLSIDNLVVLISAVSIKARHEISKWLKDNNIEHLSLDKIVFCNHKTEVLDCYSSFYDSKSKQIYTDLILSRMKNKSPERKNISLEPQYLSVVPFHDPLNFKEVFVDCGAYVGDTLSYYTSVRGGVFKKYIGFEPDYKNYTALKARVERLKKE